MNTKPAAEVILGVCFVAALAAAIAEVTSVRREDRADDARVQAETGGISVACSDSTIHPLALGDTTFILEIHAPDNKPHPIMWSVLDTSIVTVRPQTGRIIPKRASTHATAIIADEIGGPRHVAYCLLITDPGRRV